MNNLNNIKLNERDISNLAISLIKNKEYQKAEIILLNAIKKINKSHYLFNHLGYLYFETGQLDKCINFYELSLKIENKNREAYCNLGTAYLFKNYFKESKEVFEKGLKFLPNNENILVAYSQLLFAIKDTKKAFQAFESRKKTTNYLNILKKLTMNEWKGENLNNKSILILSEQGIGDIIQFSRYLFELQKLYEVKIIFKVRKNLHYLFKNMNFEIIGPEDQVPKTDFFQCLMSLPGIFLELENRFVPNYNYIKSNKQLDELWKKKIDKLNGFKIGLCWQGSQNYGRDFMRSLPLLKFEKLFLIPGLVFINLNKGFGNNQINNFKYKNKLYDFTSEIDTKSNSFEDTISILKNIDLLITTDTAVGHVASTMDKKTWLLLDSSADWRWHVETKKFRWYDNLQFFKQKKIHSWDAVIDQIEFKLKNQDF